MIIVAPMKSASSFFALALVLLAAAHVEGGALLFETNSAPEELTLHTNCAAGEWNIYNVLADYRTCGTAVVVGNGGTTSLWRSTDDNNCLGNWYRNGLLCELDDIVDESDLLVSTRVNGHTGTTFNNNAGAGVYGSIVVDMTQTVNHTYALNRFYAFQMFSDGKYTSARFYYHPNVDSVPAWDDAGWVFIPLQGQSPTADSWAPISAQSTLINEVFDPDVFDTVSTVQTRFLKLEFRNDGTHGNGTYLEIRQIRAVLAED